MTHEWREAHLPDLIWSSEWPDKSDGLQRVVDITVKGVFVAVLCPKQLLGPQTSCGV